MKTPGNQPIGHIRYSGEDQDDAGPKLVFPDAVQPDEDRYQADAEKGEEIRYGEDFCFVRFCMVRSLFHGSLPENPFRRLPAHRKRNRFYVVFSIAAADR